MAGAGDAPRFADVSVVIPTYFRDELLARCLDGVLRQRLDGRQMEIIVVDDASSPTTGGVIEGVRRSHPSAAITLVPGRRAGPAVARNMGWRRARAPVIAFIDDDACPANDDWLALGLSHFADPVVDAVCGAVTVPTPERPTDFQRNVKRLEEGVFLTCNAFYRRSALERVGGFDERFTVPFREDSDLHFRVEALGGRLIRDPRAVVIHPAPPGRFAVSLRLQRYSMFNALLYKKHPGRFRREVQSGPPWRYYALMALAAATLVSLARRRGRLAALMAAAWSLVEVEFFARRQRGAAPGLRHTADMALTSVLIPPLSIFWRLRGAWRFRVWFF
jgi:cellulose synthase/poly-beta-1,6-N-acetylglucosamine synthase-like glycosyltransferase